MNKKYLVDLILIAQAKWVIMFEPIFLTALLIAFAIACYSRIILFIVLCSIAIFLYLFIETIIRREQNNTISIIIKESKHE